MKILLAGRSAYHFSYYDSIFKSLHQKSHQVVLLFDKQWTGNQPRESLKQFCKDTGVNHGWTVRRKDFWRKYIFAIRELRSYADYLVRKGQSEFYLRRWQHYLAKSIKPYSDKKWLKRILRRRLVRELMRIFVNVVPPSQRIIRQLKEIKPDVIVTTPVNMRYSEEVEYIKAAKSLGIPATIVVLSWDNLTTKGLFHAIPDLTFAWNQTHFDEAVTIHKTPPSRTLIVGSPFFDKWFGADNLKMAKADFCNRIGIAPDKPFIVYLGSSVNIARDETWLVRDIIRALRNHPNEAIREMSLVIRPHPANTAIYEQIKEPGVVIWPRGGALPESQESQVDFYNTLYHSVATIGINTSRMIDAIILNKPCISMMTDTYRETQHQATHFTYLLQSGALGIAKTADECIGSIVRILDNKDTREQARYNFIRSFVRPYGLQYSAGEVAARALELLGTGTKPEKVAEKIKSEFSG